MAFPHPKSGKNNSGKGDKPNNGGVVREFCERAIDITGDRNAQDEVNPAENQTLGGIFHVIWLVSVFIVRVATA